MLPGLLASHTVSATATSLSNALNSSSSSSVSSSRFSFPTHTNSISISPHSYESKNVIIKTVRMETEEEKLAKKFNLPLIQGIYDTMNPKEIKDMSADREQICDEINQFNKAHFAYFKKFNSKISEIDPEKFTTEYYKIYFDENPNINECLCDFEIFEDSCQKALKKLQEFQSRMQDESAPSPSSFWRLHLPINDEVFFEITKESYRELEIAIKEVLKAVTIMNEYFLKYTQPTKGKLIDNKRHVSFDDSTYHSDDDSGDDLEEYLGSPTISSSSSSSSSIPSLSSNCVSSSSS